jgi:hypothetical protein
MHTSPHRVALSATLLLAAACGSGAPAVEYVDPEVGASLVYALVPDYVPLLTVVTQRTASGFVRDTGSGATTFVLEKGALSVASAQSRNAAGAVISTVEYSPPTPLLPADTRDAATVTTVSTMTSGGVASTVTRTVTVEGRELLTLPGGSFQALRVRSQFEGRETFTRTWFAPGVGAVQTATFQLSAPDGPPVGSQWLLVDAGATAQTSGNLDGYHGVVSLTCNGSLAAGELAGWAVPMPGSAVQRVQVTGTLAVSSATEAGAGCAIMQAMELAFPDATTLTVRRRSYVCVPSAGACAASAVSWFGRDVCGQPGHGTLETYQTSSAPAGSGTMLTLTRQGGGDCAASGQGAEPLEVGWFRPP